MLTVDPVVTASAISAGFALNNNGHQRIHYVDLMRIILESESPIIKIQGLASLLHKSALPHPTNLPFSATLSFLANTLSVYRPASPPARQTMSTKASLATWNSNT